jgi:hypothetical protein
MRNVGFRRDFATAVSDHIEASEERCIAAKLSVTQATELVAISRKRLAHSRALLSIDHAGRERGKR